MQQTLNLGELILSISQTIDLANKEIALHQQRTAYIAMCICKELKVEESLCREIFMGSLLHDIGAISVSEKTTIHKMEIDNPDLHCQKGELLLNRCSFFHFTARLIRHHHHKKSDWRGFDINDPATLGSQIINMSDCLELLIKREGEHILLQKNRIIDTLSQESEVNIDKHIVSAFLILARKESFWLELMSSRLPALLNKNSPLSNITINFNQLEIYSKFFRDLIDFKSPYTAAHSAGVSACAVFIGKLLGFTEDTIQKLKIAGNFHDLGKLIIDDCILLKEGSLTQQEFSVMKSHSYYTYQILYSVKGLEEIAEIAGYHHERANGKGYPFHIPGSKLTLNAKILILSDVMTAIMEDRPYRKGMPLDKVQEIIEELTESLELNRENVSVIMNNLMSIYNHIRTVEESIKNFYSLRIDSLNVLS